MVYQPPYYPPPWHHHHYDGDWDWDWDDWHHVPYYPPPVWHPYNPVVWHTPQYRTDQIDVQVNLHGNVPLNPGDSEVFWVEARHFYGSPYVDVELHIEREVYTYVGQLHQLVPVDGWDHFHPVVFDLTAAGAVPQPPGIVNVTTYGDNEQIDVEFDDAANDSSGADATYYQIEMKRLTPDGAPVTVIHGEVPANAGTHQFVTIDGESPLHVNPQEWLAPGNRYWLQVSVLREMPDGTAQYEDIGESEFTLDQNVDVASRDAARVGLFQKLYAPREEAVLKDE